MLKFNTDIDSLLTEGIDLGLRYKFSSTPFGDFNVRANGTFLKTLDGFGSDRDLHDGILATVGIQAGQTRNS